MSPEQEVSRATKSILEFVEKSGLKASYRGEDGSVLVVGGDEKLSDDIVATLVDEYHKIEERYNGHLHGRCISIAEEVAKNGVADKILYSKWGVGLLGMNHAINYSEIDVDDGKLYVTHDLTAGTYLAKKNEKYDVLSITAPSKEKLLNRVNSIYQPFEGGEFKLVEKDHWDQERTRQFSRLNPQQQKRVLDQQDPYELNVMLNLMTPEVRKKTLQMIASEA